MSRSEFRASSVWQFIELFDGWVEAHSPSKEGLSANDEAALWDLATMAGG